MLGKRNAAAAFTERDAAGAEGEGPLQSRSRKETPVEAGKMLRNADTYRNNLIIFFGREKNLTDILQLLDLEVGTAENALAAADPGLGLVAMPGRVEWDKETAVTEAAETEAAAAATTDSLGKDSQTLGIQRTLKIDIITKTRVLEGKIAALHKSVEVASPSDGSMEGLLDQQYVLYNQYYDIIKLPLNDAIEKLRNNANQVSVSLGSSGGVVARLYNNWRDALHAIDRPNHSLSSMPMTSKVLKQISTQTMDMLNILPEWSQFASKIKELAIKPEFIGVFIFITTLMLIGHSAATQEAAVRAAAEATRAADSNFVTNFFYSAGKVGAESLRAAIDATVTLVNGPAPLHPYWLDSYKYGVEWAARELRLSANTVEALKGIVVGGHSAVKDATYAQLAVGLSGYLSIRERVMRHAKDFFNWGAAAGEGAVAGEGGGTRRRKANRHKTKKGFKKKLRKKTRSSASKKRRSGSRKRQKGRSKHSPTRRSKM